MKKLPTTLPADNTPKTYSGTKVKAYILDEDATTFDAATITTAAIAAGAVSATLTGSKDITLPSGTVLDFGGTAITLAEDAAVTNAPTAFNIVGAPAAVAAATTADYSTARQVPVTEDIAPTLSDDEETIKLQGRATPVRVMNGKDLQASLKTIAGIDDPVVKELVVAGAQLSPDNRKRLIFAFDDGFALLALCNIGAPKPEGKGGTAQRYNFSANSTGRLFWTDMNEANPEWKEIGAL